MMPRKDITPCAHCAQPTHTPVFLEETGAQRWFCCPGCRQVYLLMCALLKETS